MTALRREIRFGPGYDRRAEGYGQHGLQIRFLAHGDAGVVQFVMGTDWIPSHVVPGTWGPRVSRRHDPAVIRCADIFPIASDLGHHWRTPTYEGETQLDCDILEGCTSCFYDGSGLNAEPVMAALFTDGHDGVWRALDEYYAYLVADESEPA